MNLEEVKVSNAEDLTAIKSPQGWFHTLGSGEPAYESRYAWCGDFHGERCPVRDLGNDYFHINKNGEPLYTQRWAYAGDFRSGRAVVQDKSGLFSHINESGGLIHGKFFLDLDVFHGDLARARDEKGWTHINLSGEPVYKRRFALVDNFYNQQTRVEEFDGSLIIINEQGETLTELRPSPLDDFAELAQELAGFQRTQLVCAALELGIFAKPPATASDLASSCDMGPNNMDRLLRALGEMGLMEERNQKWTCTRRGGLLKQNHPLTLYDAALEFARPMNQDWSLLAETLKGVPVEEKLTLFQKVAQNEERFKGFQRMQRSFDRHDYSIIAEQVPLAGVQRLIDAGGGMGTFSHLLLKIHTELNVVLLDLPGIETPNSINEEFPGRFSSREMDLFEPWLMEGDAVLLARVLSLQDDELALKILKRAAESTGKKGKIFIVERLPAEDNFAGGVADMHSLVIAGGQERSFEHYSRLMMRAGLKFQERIETATELEIIVGEVR